MLMLVAINHKEVEMLCLTIGGNRMLADDIANFPSYRFLLSACRVYFSCQSIESFGLSIPKCEGYMGDLLDSIENPILMCEHNLLIVK